LRPQQNWTWVLGDGIITLLLGGMILFQCRCAWLIGTLVGASVLFTGISRVMLSLNARSALNHPDEAATKVLWSHWRALSIKGHIA